MSAHTTSMRDALYEAPGPKTKRAVAIGTAISAVLVAALIAFVVYSFYINGQLEARYWSLFTRWTTWRYLFKGFLGTFKVALTAGVLALALGLVLMLGRTSGVPLLAAVSRVFIDFFRGLPSLLLVYFFFLVVPQYGIKMDSFWMLVLPITLTASGVLAEVLRAGVNAVPKGQVEAAYAIGLSKGQTMFKIILPQALKIVVPSLISQLVVVVKDTTVAYVVSYPDLMQNARVLISNYDALVSVYFVIAIVYILICFAINQASVAVARRSGAKVVDRLAENPV